MLSLTIPRVQAINSQGLEWGVESNTRIDYTMSVEDSENNVSFVKGLYIVVNTLPELPEKATNFSSLIINGGEYLDYYWENNSHAEAEEDLSVLPIGNWSLIQELIDPSLSVLGEGLQYIVTGTDWGYTYSSEDAQYTYLVTNIWSKSDGALNKFSLDLRYIDNEELVFHEEIVRLGYVFVPDLTPFIFLGSILGVVIVGFVVFQKRKSKE